MMKPAMCPRPHALIPVLALALIVACDKSTEPKAAALVTSVDTLRPGEIAHVRGTGLTGLQSLRIGGVEATELTIISDSEAAFRVPSMRSCETDMRVAQV